MGHKQGPAQASVEVLFNLIDKYTFRVVTLIICHKQMPQMIMITVKYGH